MGGGHALWGRVGKGGQAGEEEMCMGDIRGAQVGIGSDRSKLSGGQSKLTGQAG